MQDKKDGVTDSSSKIERHWQRIAPRYVLLRSLFPLKQIHAAEIRNLKTLLSPVLLDPECDRILDVGTGTGAARQLFPRHHRSFAVDRHDAMISESHQRGHRNLIIADANNLPFREGSFTIVMAVGLLEYMKEIDESLKELARVSARNGFLLLTFSQRNILNSLRKLIIPVHLCSLSHIRRTLTSLGFTISAMTQSLIQIQILIRFSGATNGG